MKSHPRLAISTFVLVFASFVTVLALRSLLESPSPSWLWYVVNGALMGAMWTCAAYLLLAAYRSKP